MRIFIMALALLGFIWVLPAGATTCMHSTCKEYLMRHDLVFKGKATASGETTAEMQKEFEKNKPSGSSAACELPDTYTDFDIITLYKGAPRKTARVYYSAHRKGGIIGDFDVKAYPDGTETTIYATRTGGFYATYRGLCSGCGGAEQLDTIRAEYDAIDGLIAKFPQTLEFYTKKAAMLEANKDFEAAAYTYEQAFKDVPAAKDNAELKAQYGRILQLADRPDDAIKVLKSVEGTKGADTGIQLSLLRLGRAAELSGKKLAMAGQELVNLELKDADLSGADFSGAKLQRVKFTNVTLTGANFSNALMEVEIRDSKLDGANFEGAKGRGFFFKSNFDKARFAKSEMDMRAADGNSFKGADFSGSKFFIAECSGIPKDAVGNDFSGAVFRDATFSGLYKSKIAGADLTGMKFHTGRCGPNNQGVDLSGRKLDGLQFDNVDFTGASFKGASLKNAIFAGATLKEADFTGADLTGATFPINSYRGQVKLEGANFTDAKIDGVTWTGAAFDCKTKFPKGFDPAAAEMQTKDASCAAGQLKNPGVVDYSKERLGQGYMSVCNGDYHADCIYGFLSSYVVKHVDWGYEREFVRLAKSFVEAGYPELAKVMALKFIGGIALSRHSLDPKYFATWIPVMEQVEAAEKGGTVGKPQTVKLERRQEGEAQALADQSRQAAEAGDYKQAVSYADQIGDAAYNRDVLKWPADGGPIRPTSTESFYHYDREFTAALGAVALERRRQNKDIDAITRYIRDIEGRKPQNRDGSRDRDTLGVLDILAGVETPAAAPEKSYSRRSEPARYAAAYAAAGKPDKAWEIYAEAAGMDTRMGVSALEAIADYYAAHPDDKGRQKVLDELVKLGLESWPADGAKARGGFESDVYGTFFGIAAEMKAEKLVRDILSRTEKYENEGLRARVRLFAATALAEMGKGAEALALFEKSRQAFTELPPEAQGGRRGMPKYMIMLGAVNSATVMKQPPSFIQDQDIGKFILRLAASGAPLEDKKKALAAGRELLSAGKAGSALFRAQLAVATAAVLKDKESGQRMKDAQYGVPAAAFAGLLHDAGFHTAEKQLIDVAWASQGAPHSVGLDRLGPRGGFARMRNGMQLAALAGMLAKDGHFDAAERAAMTVVDPSSIQRLGGTDYVAYFMRQKALHDTAALAAAKGKADVAADIAAAKMNYAPYQSGVYFALANASFDAKKTADAKAYYDKGYALAPNFGDAMGAPLVDPDGLALDILVTRAAAEKKLGLADNLARTQAFAQQAAAVAEMDVQRGKTSVAVERIARIIAGTKATKQQDIDDFIAQLKIRDDLNSTDVVADMAEKFLAAGEPEKARAVALYGFRNIDNYPQASGKTTVLLPYASLIARTEPKMGRESVEKIKAILMQVHGNSPGSKITPEDEKRDLIGEGIKAYEELKRRNAMDAAPKDDGSDRLTKLKKDGSIVYNGGGWLMQQWLAGAAQKLKPGDPAGAAAVIAAKTPDTNNHFGGLDRNYGVITREITLPSQAYGGPINGRYIVPADVPRPKGPRHEMTIFYMKDFTCEGNFEPFCKY